jgi:amidohydrolase
MEGSMRNPEIERKRSTLKEAAVGAIDSRRKELIDISLEIHANPELIFKEFKASRLLADYLNANGFSIEAPAYGLETAFRATLGNRGPKLAIMAEYDALPELGHACGHNIIGAAAVGAGMALSSIVKELGVTIVVFGTPAEEFGQAKELMARRGAFKDIDAAMMIHAYNSDMLDCNCGAVCFGNVKYIGKAAHPCTPEKGINALDAMLIGFGAFNTMRYSLLTANSAEEAVFGVISKGGVLNFIPGQMEAEFCGFGMNDEVLKQLLEKIRRCFDIGATATGAEIKFSYDWDSRVKAVFSNKVLCDVFDANIRTLRPNWNPVTPHSLIHRCATDMGSVSQVAPSIHAWIAIASQDIGWHSVESCAAAASHEGHKGMLDGAKAMAMTAIDLSLEPDLLKRAQEQFRSLGLP